MSIIRKFLKAKAETDKRFEETSKRMNWYKEYEDNDGKKESIIGKFLKAKAETDKRFKETSKRMNWHKEYDL